MNIEGIILLFIYFSTLASFFYAAGTAIRSQKLDKKFKEVLESEGQIKGYIEYIHWMKDRNPWGGLVPASVARKNIIRANDSKELTDIAEQWVDNLREHQKRGMIAITLLASLILVHTLTYDQSKAPKSEYNTSEEQPSTLSTDD